MLGGLFTKPAANIPIIIIIIIIDDFPEMQSASDQWQLPNLILIVSSSSSDPEYALRLFIIIPYWLLSSSS